MNPSPTHHNGLHANDKQLVELLSRVSSAYLAYAVHHSRNPERAYAELDFFAEVALGRAGSKLAAEVWSLSYQYVITYLTALNESPFLGKSFGPGAADRTAETPGQDALPEAPPNWEALSAPFPTSEIDLYLPGQLGDRPLVSLGAPSASWAHDERIGQELTTAEAGLLNLVPVVRADALEERFMRCLPGKHWQLSLLPREHEAEGRRGSSTGYGAPLGVRLSITPAGGGEPVTAVGYALEGVHSGCEALESAVRSAAAQLGIGSGLDGRSRIKVPLDGLAPGRDRVDGEAFPSAARRALIGSGLAVPD